MNNLRPRLRPVRAHVSAILMNRSVSAFILFVLFFATTGCGYRLVTQTDTAPVPQLSLGAIEAIGLDETLIIRARARLTASLRRRGAPRVVPDAPTQLRIVVQVPSMSSIGYDRDGNASVHTASVAVELTLARANVVVWTSGPVSGRSPFTSGRSLYETARAKRQSLSRSLDAAIDAALARLFRAAPLDGANS